MTITFIYTFHLWTPSDNNKNSCIQRFKKKKKWLHSQQEQFHADDRFTKIILHELLVTVNPQRQVYVYS